jgi:hypothetical protein
MAGRNSLSALYDVSFAGSRIVIGGANITEFMDDSNPIDIQDTETTNIEWSCNGRMIRTIKPAAIILSITVIPGSASDNSLRKIWKNSFCNGGSVDIDQANQSLNCIISAGNPNIGSFTFTGGTPISGAAALTANGQGKMGGNTYTFAFENVE